MILKFKEVKRNLLLKFPGSDTNHFLTEIFMLTDLKDDDDVSDRIVNSGRSLITDVKIMGNTHLMLFKDRLLVLSELLVGI